TCGTVSSRTLGTATDLWGLSSLEPADVNNTDFFVLVNAGGGTKARYIDGVTVTVSYAPKPPTSLTATQISTSQVNLAWTDNSTLEDEFHIERCNGATCANWVDIATVAANTTSYS